MVRIAVLDDEPIFLDRFVPVLEKQFDGQKMKLVITTAPTYPMGHITDAAWILQYAAMSGTDTTQDSLETFIALFKS